MIRARHHLIREARKYQAAFYLSDPGAVPAGRNLTAVHEEEEDFQTLCTLPTERGGARAGQACQDKIFQQHSTNASTVSMWLRAARCCVPQAVLPACMLHHVAPAARTTLGSCT